MRRPVLAALSTLCGSLALAQDKPFYESMDFGPMLCTTLRGGDHGGITYKGVVVRLGDDAAVAFDTELLRMSSAWTDGWLWLRGTAYDGAHGPMPSPRGETVAETRQAPGWANAGSFDDTRAIPFGPLPREWGHYDGVALRGDQVVIAYQVGDMTVREGYRLVDRAHRTIGRTLELGPSTHAQRMVVLDGPTVDGIQAVAGKAPARSVRLAWQPKVAVPVDLDSTTGDWHELRMGGPSRGDYLDASSGTGATISFVPAFSRVHGSKPTDDPQSLLLPKLCDGEGSTGANDRDHAVWFDKRKVDGRDRDDGRFVIDLKRTVAVSRVDTFTWAESHRSIQRYQLYGSAAEQLPDVAANDPAAAGWTAIAEVDSERLGEGDKHGVGIARPEGLGTFRHLLIVWQRGGAMLSEIDVFADTFHSPLEHGANLRFVACALRGDDGPSLAVDGARVVLDVPPHAAPQRLELLLAAGDQRAEAAIVEQFAAVKAPAPLPTEPAKARWGEPIEVVGERGSDDGAFAVDTITIPFENRFHSRMRTCAFDFFADGRAAITTWNGDVWIVGGLDDGLQHVTWRRYATGLFDPLGLAIVDGKVVVHTRGGLVRLHDDNGDGEADRHESLCNGIYITDAFHEFDFDLQVDAEGNYYVAKAAPVNPGGRGFMKIVPHHGTILKISKDGTKIEPIATGLRAPNGIGVSPTGIVTSGDNEGTFIPRCRLNWIEQPGFYGGVKDTAHRSPVPDAPDLPLCWFPMEVDNSSGGQVWVTGKGWPDLQGRLLHLSYGTCSVYLVEPERVNGHMQGGVVRLPADFSSSCMRARFAPHDGQLYVAGFQGWQTSAARDGGFHRVRRTQQPLGLPIALRTTVKGVYLTFAAPLDPATAADAGNYGVEVWNYLYSGNYGSPELSVLHPERKVAEGQPNRDPLSITAATLSPDRCTVFLAVDGMRPVMQMKVTWNVDDAAGATRKGELHNSIHALAEDHGFAEVR